MREGMLLFRQRIRYHNSAIHQGRPHPKENDMLNNLTLDQLITAFVVFLGVIATVAFIVYLKNRSGHD